MRAMQVTKAGGPFELVEREIPNPSPRQVRVKVQACGVCHSDSLTKEGIWPGIVYPRIPGHEIAGVIDAIGSDVPEWKPGQRVGVGWFGGNCGYCDNCRHGKMVLCIRGQISGITFDGGYADYVLVPYEALARIPDDINPVDAGPLLCAGITTFNSLRNSGARAGDIVAILGIGGLGHLGVQFASKMGFRTVAIARGKDKEKLARELGAQHYIDSQAGSVSEQLNAKGLGVDGKLIILGAAMEPLQVSSLAMIRRTQGHPGMAFRYVDRFRGHHAVQRHERSASHDGSISAGTCGRGL